MLDNYHVKGFITTRSGGIPILDIPMMDEQTISEEYKARFGRAPESIEQAQSWKAACRIAENGGVDR